MGNIEKYIGSTGWSNANGCVSADLERAIRRGKTEVVLEFHCESFRYTVTLRRKTENEFSGVFTATKGSAVESGRANCKMIFSGRDALIVGTWDEEGESFDWWARLEQVEHFPDEQRLLPQKGRER